MAVSKNISYATLVDCLYEVIGAEKSRFDLELKVLYKMDGVVLSPTILTKNADVEFWLDEYSICFQHHTPLCVTMIKRCSPNIATDGYSQMQSFVPETAKEENEDHHTKPQLYDLSACHLVEPTNTQVPGICEIYEQLNDWGEDAVHPGETMAFYGEKMNLNSDDDNSMSDDGCNNDNYDTTSQLMHREKDGITCGK
ncbi:hypothetical protein TorRG33x02_158210 [Trema orientale]|uniref:Uncharacterized protein n=1 Tax=Trema orientale TaxID=63057 RepID=A0A2P5ESK2_TREOI|nr:hypothetical protein TorRG33x02_158210 [Trema orientale]